MRNRAPLDAWTPVHVGAGAVFELAGVAFPLALVMAVGYELAEQVIERSEAGQAFFGTQAPESAANVATDLAAFALGFGAVRLLRLPRR